MSRIGKKPIPIPEKTEVFFENGKVRVTGPKGQLEGPVHRKMDLVMENGEIRVAPKVASRDATALQGLTRSLIANMVTGVNSGFQRVLEIQGIGYRVESKGRSLVLHIGYSTPVNFDLPEGIEAVVEKNTILKLSGIDKQRLGQTAASIRDLRPPEPYKGKGIKYAEEMIQKKAGKAGGK